jgi:hypothetical protein
MKNGNLHKEQSGGFEPLATALLQTPPGGSFRGWGREGTTGGRLGREKKGGKETKNSTTSRGWSHKL